MKFDIRKKTGLVCSLAPIFIGFICWDFRICQINDIYDILVLYFLGVVVVMFVAGIAGGFSEVILRKDLDQETTFFIIGSTIIIFCFALWVLKLFILGTN